VSSGAGVIFLSLHRKIVRLLDCRAKDRKTKMTSVAILLILLPTGLALGYHRYLGARATRHVSIEVACLSLDQIVDIGTKSSTSMVKRAVGRPQPYAAADGAVEWRTRSKGGVMLYRVLPLPDYLGFRVESWATTVTITRMQGSQDLLRRRRRTLEAIARAGLPVPPPAFVRPETAETVRA
jgi:hypothetical protein